MIGASFPTVLDVLRHLQPVDVQDRAGMRSYAKAVDFVHRLWPALSAAAGARGETVSEFLYEDMKSLGGIQRFISSSRHGVEREALEDYLEDLSSDPEGLGMAHARVLEQVDIALLATLPAHEIYRRLECATAEAQRASAKVRTLEAAIDDYVSAQGGAAPLPGVVVAEVRTMGQPQGQRGLDRALDLLLGARKHAGVVACATPAKVAEFSHG